MTPSSDIHRLLEIMKALRTPVTGCPWDLEQTFSSIAPYTIEEAYEVADAIDRKDMIDLEDELGDLLLQVVYHAQMASEDGAFCFDDVVLAITRKMIRRHPHVFAAGDAKTPEGVKVRWEEIKAEEKLEKEARKQQNGTEQTDISATSLLDDVPRKLPALMEAQKLQKRAGTVGFDWNSMKLVLNKIEEEIGEIREAMERAENDIDAQKNVQAEVGDLLFAAVNAARHAGIEAEDALRQTNNKFRFRFRYIEENSNNLIDATLEEMENLWIQAKSVG